MNIVHKSIVFNKRVQSAAESVDDFLMIDLEQLALSCDYEDPERQARDRFIAGLKDSALQKISSSSPIAPFKRQLIMLVDLRKFKIT